MKVGFTGTKKGMNKEQYDALSAWALVMSGLIEEFHHSDFIGSEEQAYDIFQTQCDMVVHPTLKKNGPLIRRFDRNGKKNSIMPATSETDRIMDMLTTIDMLICVPENMYTKRQHGIWQMVRKAGELKVPTLIVWPSGRIEMFNSNQLTKQVYRSVTTA